MKGLVAAIMALSGAITSGCISVKSYVDPQYRQASYEAIQRPPQPIAARVDVHFMRNGEAFPKADSELRGNVERSLRATGVFVPSTSAAAPLISITANNVADLGAARAKGFGTGLTFGAAGSMIDDFYEFSCSYDNGGAAQKLDYKHAIHTSVGNAKAPEGMTATTPANAFGQVIDDVVLNFVKDLQARGALARQ